MPNVEIVQDTIFNINYFSVNDCFGYGAYRPTDNKTHRHTHSQMRTLAKISFGKLDLDFIFVYHTDWDNYSLEKGYISLYKYMIFNVDN